MHIKFTGLRDTAINDIATLSMQLKSLHNKLDELNPVNGQPGPRPETMHYLDELTSQLDETSRQMATILESPLTPSPKL